MVYYLEIVASFGKAFSKTCCRLFRSDHNLPAILEFAVCALIAFPEERLCLQLWNWHHFSTAAFSFAQVMAWEAQRAIAELLRLMEFLEVLFIG